MKKHTFVLALLMLSFVLSVFGTGIMQNWSLSDSYSVSFSNPEVKGVFSKINADITFDESNLPASSFRVSADVGSVNTGNPSMDAEITGKEMLEMDKYPQIKFESTKVTKSDTGYIAAGTLEMHGIKKPLLLSFIFSGQTFKGSFLVRCSEFGMKGMGTGESDKVFISLSVPVKPKN